MATDRIILHSSIASSFTTALKKALEASADGSSPLPTLVTAASKARVEAVISNAISSGAHLIHGNFEPGQGSKSNGNDAGVRMAPIILGGAQEDMKIWQDEAFAPLAACMIVDNDEDAVKIANKGGYGLSAAIFTEDLRKGLAMAKKIESG